jgi:hypothetical protein
VDLTNLPAPPGAENPPIAATLVTRSASFLGAHFKEESAIEIQAARDGTAVPETLALLETLLLHADHDRRSCLTV